MSDELVEAVARAISEATSGPFEFLSELGRDAARDEARAAIDVVIERCARVVEDWSAHTFPAPEQEATSIAAAIRKLGERE